MKSIRLRRYFFTDNPFAFWRWLPDGLENALDITIQNVNFKMCVHLEYEETSDFKISPEDVPRGNHWIKAFLVYLTVPVEDDSDPNLYQMEPPDEVVSQVGSAIRQFEATLHGIVRNEIGQFWLHNSHKIDSLSDREILVNMQIMNPEGEWAQFCGGSISLKSPLPSSDELINQERWLHLKELLESNYKSDLSLVFFRNAQLHLRKDNFRLAIVEACIALERAISIFIPNFIEDEVKEKYNLVLSSDSLSKKVKTLLPLLMDGLDINDETIKTCLQAVNMRNQVVHRSRVRLREKEIEDALQAIKKILDKLNPRKFEIVDEDPWKKGTAV